MDKILPNLYVGNSADAQADKVLKAEGIRAILNCAFDLHIKQDPALWMSTTVGLVDGPGNNPMIYDLAADTLQFFLEAGGCVFVHCHEGKSRTIAVVLMWMLKYGKKWASFKEALDFVRAKREINLHPAHASFLKGRFK